MPPVLPSQILLGLHKNLLHSYGPSPLKTKKDPCSYLCTANARELLLSNLQSNSWSFLKKKNSSLSKLLCTSLSRSSSIFFCPKGGKSKEETAYNEVLCHSQVTTTCATSAFIWSAAVKFCTAMAQISTNVSTAQKLHIFIHFFHMQKHDQQKGIRTHLSQHIHLHPLLQCLNSTSLLSSRFHHSGNSGISNSSTCEGSLNAGSRFWYSTDYFRIDVPKNISQAKAAFRDKVFQFPNHN